MSGIKGKPQFDPAKWRSEHYRHMVTDPATAEVLKALAQESGLALTEYLRELAAYAKAHSLTKPPNRGHRPRRKARPPRHAMKLPKNSLVRSPPTRSKKSG